MMESIRERIISLVLSRVFFLMLCIIVLSAVLILRIFDLQIVHGEEYLNNFKLKIRKERFLGGTRGNIYDRNGVLLAYNKLAYNITIEDVYETGRDKNKNLNSTLSSIIDIIEESGDRVINDFDIILDKNGRYQFSREGDALFRFLADVYGCKTVSDLKFSQRTATPDEVIEYLAGTEKYGIGEYNDPENRKNFVVGKGMSKRKLLQIVTIRYAMSANSFQKYIATVVASDVSEKCVAVILENSDVLDGVSVAEDTVRKYMDSVYFSHIIGYTGRISQDELVELQKDNPNYTANDMVGKAGIEQNMELKLQGVKGREVIYVDNLGKIIETTERTEPIAGNDLYLTIDSNLQKAVYNILEQKIAGILISKISNIKEYKSSAHSTASDIRIPIGDVYYALFNNNVIDISRFEGSRAKDTEKEVYRAFLEKRENTFDTLRTELTEKKTPYSGLSDEYKVYESYIVSLLSSGALGLLDDAKIDKNDEIYKKWRNDESISLYEYLNYAISKNWIDISAFNLSDQYASSEEMYEKLVDAIFEGLYDNEEFSKKLYKYMIINNQINGRQICQVLLEQDIIEVTEKEEADLNNGKISAYDFMLHLISVLAITPAQLALDPCSGSSVITDVNSGEVLALVTYPGYDINRLANNIDSEYYSQLQVDLSKPMWNYATQQRSAPGSTFKMVSTVAGFEEKAINVGERLLCNGVFDKITPSPRCWIAGRGTHGHIDATGGIENSCNCFFYEVGYRLGSQNGGYDSDLGLQKLAKYAEMFGLGETSGIEITESEPSISDFDAVRSAIGQGTNNFTTVGLARYVTGVANSGTIYKLSLIDKLTDRSGNVLKDYVPEIRNTIELSDSEWKSIHTGMRRVVMKKAYYSTVSVEVAGKTGTAQENKSRPPHALFVGYAPYNNPEMAITTRVAFGYSSDYAAEISRDIIKYYFDLDEEDSILTGTAETPDAVATGGD